MTADSWLGNHYKLYRQYFALLYRSKYTHSNDGATASRSWVRSTTDDVLAGKEPVPPAEATDMVQCLQEQHGSLGVLDSVFLDTDLLGLFTDVGQELAVRERAIGTEFVENFGERGGWHGDLAEVVEQGDL